MKCKRWPTFPSLPRTLLVLALRSPARGNSSDVGKPGWLVKGCPSLDGSLSEAPGPSSECLPICFLSYQGPGLFLPRPSIYPLPSFHSPALGPPPFSPLPGCQDCNVPPGRIAPLLKGFQSYFAASEIELESRGQDQPPTSISSIFSQFFLTWTLAHKQIYLRSKSKQIYLRSKSKQIYLDPNPLFIFFGHLSHIYSPCMV